MLIFEEKFSVVGRQGVGLLPSSRFLLKFCAGIPCMNNLEIKSSFVFY